MGICGKGVLVLGGIGGAVGLLGGGVTTQTGGTTGGKLWKTVAEGVGKEVEGTGAAGVAGVAGSPPGTVWGVCGRETWVMRAATLLVALSKSWETSAWSLDSLGVLG